MLSWILLPSPIALRRWRRTYLVYLRITHTRRAWMRLRHIPRVPRTTNMLITVILAAIHKRTALSRDHRCWMLHHHHRIYRVRWRVGRGAYAVRWDWDYTRYIACARLRDQRICSSANTIANANAAQRCAWCTEPAPYSNDAMMICGRSPRLTLSLLYEYTTTIAHLLRLNLWRCCWGGLRRARTAPIVVVQRCALPVDGWK